MNAARRRVLDKATALIGEARDLITQAAEEEREALENSPDSLQYGAKGEAMGECADTLTEQAGELENIEAAISEAKGGNQ